ncbi:hypothetical protein SB2_25480 [Methylobacterium radiotolerans]|nr:hypothetical protein SB2_25480 [Methylobacterium radiotolerans]
MVPDKRGDMLLRSAAGCTSCVTERQHHVLRQREGMRLDQLNGLSLAEETANKPTIFKLSD